MAYSRRELPPLNALRAFEVAGRKLNFRAAADELGVTQAAVAQQVRTLEQHVGQPLFNRLPRGLSLTAHGAIYLSDISRAFDTLNAATARFSVQPEMITISVTPTFATKMLIPRIAELRAACPGVQFRTIATEVLSDFDRDNVDIAIRVTRPPFPETWDARLLFRQELIVVASPDLVSGVPLPLSPSQLREFPLLHDAYDHWQHYFHANDMPFGSKYNQTALALDAALAGQGLAITCKAFVASDLEAGRLVQVMETNVKTEANYYMVRKKVSYPGKAAERVWNWCTERYSSGP